MDSPSRFSRASSEWQRASNARIQYSRLAPPPVTTSGIGSPPLPRMASLLNASAAAWPLEGPQPPSDAGSSNYTTTTRTTTSDAATEMEVEGEYMLNHLEALRTRLHTPLSKVHRVASISAPSAMASYERLLRLESRLGYSNSSSGSSSTSSRGYDTPRGAHIRSDATSLETTYDDAGRRMERQPPISDDADAEMTSALSVEKSSRYLREIDRRAILRRIEAGEKQSVLAKEYQVSRAAICNLNKHRDEVFARKDGNPLAKHLKKPRPKTPKPTIAGMPSSMKWSSSGSSKYSYVLGSSGGSSLERSQLGVHEMKSRAAALLLTTLRKKITTPIEFRRVSERLMRLLLEEALALVPIRRVDILLYDQRRESGVVMEHPPCAISMEQEDCLMRELFHEMEPEQPTGYICFDDLDESEAADAFSLRLFDSRESQLPQRVPAGPRGKLWRAVVCRRAMPAGARRQPMMCIVSLLASSGAVQQLRSQHPDVKFLTLQIVPDDEVDAEEREDADEQPSTTTQTSLMRLRLEQAYQASSF